MRDDLEFIKKKMKEDKIPTPKCLEEDMIKEKLKGVKPVKQRFVKTKIFKTLAGLAACLVITVTCISIGMPIVTNDKKQVAQQEKTNEILSTFTSYDDIKKTMNQIESNGNAVELYSEKTENTKEARVSTSSYADTYKQVDAVDEADIFKNDGKYFYFVKNGVIRIYSVKNGKTKLVSTIKEYEAKNDENADYSIVDDIFIHENRLIVNVDRYTSKKNRNFTETAIYDIIDRKNPKKIKTFEQSGYYQSSRMIGDKLYLISNDGIEQVLYKDIKEYVPCVSEDAKEETTIAAKDIACVEEPNVANYLVVSVIDTKTSKKAANTKAVLGVGTTIYCNEQHMYVVQEKGNYSNDIYKTTSEIIKIDLAGDEIKFTNTGKVDGRLYGQFAMDEKDGYLRVATTSTSKDGKDINNLYILDSNLKKVGEVTGFAKNESIKAVRYIKDKAYVITYEQTDPLFIIDLSNPKNPKIEGSIKITGFSSLLVPVDDKTLLGIGYNTEKTQLGEALDGIKIAVFDISDSGKPKVLDSKILKGAYSDVQYDHKALVVNSEKEYYAIPYNQDQYNDNKLSQGVLTFKVQNGKIKITNQFKENVNDYNQILRCTYVDDYVYAINENGKITGYKYKELE